MGTLKRNPFPCSGENVGKFKYTVHTPAWINVGTFARQWRMGMFFFLLIEDGGSNWRLQESIFILYIISSALLCFRRIVVFIVDFYHMEDLNL